MMYGLDPPMKLWSEKEQCAYPPCGCSLNRIHNLWKAHKVERYYCSEAHRNMGEEARLQLTAQAAGRVS